jgi:hypothetical protein
MNHAGHLATRTCDISRLRVQSFRRHDNVLDGLALRRMARHRESVSKFPKSPRLDRASVGSLDHAGCDPINDYDLSVQDSSVSVVGADEQPVAGSDIQLPGASDGIGAASEGQPLFARRRLDENTSVRDSPHLGEFPGFEPIRSPVERGDHSRLVIPSVPGLSKGPLEWFVDRGAFSGAKQAPRFELVPQFRGKNPMLGPGRRYGQDTVELLPVVRESQEVSDGIAQVIGAPFFDPTEGIEAFETDPGCTCRQAPHRIPVGFILLSADGRQLNSAELGMGLQNAEKISGLDSGVLPAVAEE